MKKITFFKSLILAVVLLLGSTSVFSTESIIYSTGFESSEGFTAATSYNNTTVIYKGATGYLWGTYYGTPSTNSVITGAQSMQMRFYTSALTNYGYTFTNFNLSNVSKVTFNAKNASNANVIVSYSTDGGTTYIGDQTFSLSTTANEYTYNVSATGEFPSVRLKFTLSPTQTSSGSSLIIDDVNVYGIVTTPTITVTELTVPAMTAYAGETDAETINVSGVNLTANIALALSGTDASMFELSTNSVTQTSGTAANTEVSVTYRPTAAGTHTATLTLSSTGATSVTRTLNGTSTWKPLNPPVATAASASNSSGFTANWDAVTGASEYQLNVYTKSSGTAATDLFFSEYIEGSSNNKAIEIYNGTGSAVNLSGYSIKKQTNGAGDYGNELVLSGSLAHGDVYVIAYNQANSSILALADLQTSNSVVNFNGNDAVALFKGTTQIDEVGIFNQVTPDWGADVTLIRKSSVSSPVVPYDATQWNSNATDYINDLGSHVMSDAIVFTPIAGSPFTVTETSKALTGLDAATTYYYSVIAKDAHVSSPVSNEIVGSTLGTSLDDQNSELGLLVSNGNIKFTATAGETVEIFNVIGQRLVSKTTIAGLNSIQLAARGVMLVKIGTRISKVIM